MYFDGSFSQLLGGGAGQSIVGTVDLDQGAQRGRSIALGKGRRWWVTSVVEVMGIKMLCNQVAELSARIAGYIRDGVPKRPVLATQP